MTRHLSSEGLGLNTQRDRESGYLKRGIGAQGFEHDPPSHGGFPMDGFKQESESRESVSFNATLCLSRAEQSRCVW